MITNMERTLIDRTNFLNTENARLRGDCLRLHLALTKTIEFIETIAQNDADRWPGQACQAFLDRVSRETNGELSPKSDN